MIQRIQSVYLSLSLILIGLIGWLPLGEIATDNNVYLYTIRGIFDGEKSLANGWPLLLFWGIIELLLLIILFSYKKRVRQMRIATFNIILMIGFIGVCWFFIHQSMESIGEGVYVFKIALSFPLISAILTYLAIRAIGKDEALVRSIDRIR
jgi:hypothetical protein